LFYLDSGDVLVASLGKAMRPRRTTNKEKVEDGTEVTITFTQHGQLRFINKKGKAELYVLAADEVEDAILALAPVGLDPVAEPLSWTRFGELLTHHNMPLKTLLKDQNVIIGIGNMYADEILFSAGLRFDRSSSELSSQEVRRLYRALVETLHDAMKYRGTSLSDSDYVDVFGEAGTYQEHLQVFQREGDLSPRSRAPILKTKFNGSLTYYCETQV
jgi:formamidopyrimidine-DNA glycosylase